MIQIASTESWWFVFSSILFHSYLSLFWIRYRIIKPNGIILICIGMPIVERPRDLSCMRDFCLLYSAEEHSTEAFQTEFFDTGVALIDGVRRVVFENMVLCPGEVRGITPGVIFAVI